MNRLTPYAATARPERELAQRIALINRRVDATERATTAGGATTARSTEDRLADIEARLDAIEAALAGGSP